MRAAPAIRSNAQKFYKKAKVLRNAMSGPLRHFPTAYWGQRAHNARRMAMMLPDTGPRSMMEQIADDYDHLAWVAWTSPTGLCTFAELYTQRCGAGTAFAKNTIGASIMVKGSKIKTAAADRMRRQGTLERSQKIETAIFAELKQKKAANLEKTLELKALRLAREKEIVEAAEAAKLKLKIAKTKA